MVPTGIIMSACMAIADNTPAQTNNREKARTAQTAAIVVTRDRPELLERCLVCLLAQTVPCDVLVVDNESRADTGELVRKLAVGAPGIRYRRLSANTGGAGGFNCGVRWAYSDGYAYLWLMDDDCQPRPDALQVLLAADKTLGGPAGYGFLSSLALWKDGSECLMNRQKPRRRSGTRPRTVPGLVEVEQATFVSLFLPAGTVQHFGLPIADYFIWGDDIEYTRRIAIRGRRPGYLVKASVVIHATRRNVGSDVATDDPARLERYRLSVRNEAFTYRQEGFTGVLRYLYRCMRSLWHVVCHATNHRRQRIAAVVGGMRQGIGFCPAVEILPAKQEGKTDG